jgi:hypothetical protein
MGTVQCPVLTDSCITVHNITLMYHWTAEAEYKGTILSLMPTCHCTAEKTETIFI